MKNEILDIVRRKGLLVEREIFDLLDRFPDKRKVEEFLDGIERHSGQKIITKSILSRNSEFLMKTFGSFNEENKRVVENTSIKLGISLEVTKEKQIIENNPGYGVFY